MTSYLSSLIWGTTQVDDAVDKATSELLPSGSEDIALNLEISDQIRSKSVQPKDAMRALKRRLNHKNPNVQLLALGLTDTCIKNGGDAFLVEIASREFMDNLVSLLRMPGLNFDVKNKILRFLQNWALTFEGKPSLGYVGEVYKMLQREGFTFPPRDPAATSSAMVDTQTAPEWIDSDVCLRCRTPFTFTNRKHHCRNCGQVFDQQCSSKTLPLPHFGITQEVRVCDSCYTKLNKKAIKPHRSSQSVSSARHRSARDFADAELQRAIQLSLEEVGAAGGRKPGYVPSPSPWQISEPPLVDRKTHPYAASSASQHEEEDDPDLKAAIEASLREANMPRPSAPIGIETPSAESSVSYAPSYGYPQSYPPSVATPKPRAPSIPNFDLEPLETDAILTFNQTVEQMQTQGITDLTRYPAVTELYDKANALRPKLAMSLNDTDRKEQLLKEMHEKLSQAVKLYDNLLTEQVSRPAWRAASTAPSVSYQQPNSGYAPQYMTAEGGYSQWVAEAPSQPQMSPQMQTGPYRSDPSYFAPAAPEQQMVATISAPVTSPQAETYPGQPYQSRPPLASPQQLHVLPPHELVGQPSAAPVPVSIPQYGVPTPASPSAVPYSPPVPPQSVPISIPQPQQPAPAVIPSQPPPPQAPLFRSNTVASHATSSQAPPANQYLARHNTMSHAPQQLQQLQQLSAPPPLPNFPIVPTAAPQVYDAYGAPVEAERKEALLIEL
ncbi:ubiquitin binding protein [Laetiporus sulphureus 93-53]|uniref:Vacuolar protein sorting-associated protein 27 n=1 Tax=Laetiporus sulphureus 93-53 TaxID=1314785 RepID=A0A165FIB9_9APHY|nr:ubiquitin binding protein [Laetiporus sulphureus 93-53]KZT09013.1 ubiquitin binding protein [Laetiporus sulphureus 93-53]